MRHFRLFNNLTGWTVFTVSAFVYIRTLEPSASFWDCGEFIAAAYKLQVPHPPGAPLFLLIYRLFSLLALGDTQQVALRMNLASALCSAFTILFLYWTITLLGRKIIRVPFNQLSLSQGILLLSSGLVGSLAYAFSDSFWFSATETEVYAMSSLLTAFVVWATLKWELIADERAALRWLLLIAYVLGLSIGVHLLNLVTVPALALVYYFHRHTPNLRGISLTLAIGMFIIFMIMIGVRILLPTLAGELEIMAVNRLGLPFGSGIAVFVLLFVGLFVYGIVYSIRRQKLWLNTMLLGSAFVLIGYSSYTLALIRSHYNPPINENQPDNVLSFVYYLNLKQYPTRPLLYGPYFTAPYVDQERGGAIYIKGKHKYEIAEYDRKVIYDKKQSTFFPRLYSRDRGHPQVYGQILGLKEGQKPSFADNLRYLIGHQLGYQYGRYLMWNFAGRESDHQGADWLLPWSTGKLPSSLAGNAAHNNYRMLPLLLGLVGLVYQYRRHPPSFWVTLLLFVMLGGALVGYLNPPPTEPRERDYIYTGSFYAFAIWIGLGVMALASTLSYLIRNRLVGTSLAALTCLVVPGIMADQGWNDHNRAGRYVAVDTAKNMLSACAPNAILLTNGDNDTFPLWYAQEVEGFRTDVRVMISGYLNFDWYVDQMRRPVYQSDPIPLSLHPKNYVTGKNSQIAFVENPEVKDGINLPQYLKLIREDSPVLQMPLQDGEMINILPSHRLVLPVDKQAVLKQGIVASELHELLGDTMEITLNKTDLYREDLIFLDMLATNQWKRPVYFAGLFNASKYNLQEYTQVEGMVYRLLPVKVPGASQGYVNSALMYENMMHRSFWRNLDNPSVYHDEEARDRHILPSRLQFCQLATQLIREGKTDKAREVMLYCLQVIPDKSIPYDYADSMLIAPLIQVGETDLALEIASKMAGRADENLTYYLKSKGSPADVAQVRDNLGILHNVVASLKETRSPEASRYDALFRKHLNHYNE